MGIYIKSAGLAFSAALVAAAVWAVGGAIYARVVLSRIIAPTHEMATAGAARLVEVPPLVVVVVFAIVYAVVARRLRHEAAGRGGDYRQSSTT